MTAKMYPIALLGVLMSVTCLAEQKIAVLALFKDKVLVTIDGQRRIINVGKTSPEGVTLISANSKQATMRADGKTVTLNLGAGAAVYDGEAKNRKLEVLITKDKQGMFSTEAVINGTATVAALVDTGASEVAMNRKMAEKLQLNLSSGTRQAVDTAGGQANSQEIMLDSIKVGTIELHNVSALIVDSSGMDNYILLGMSFLGRLKMINNPSHLLLVYSGEKK